MLLLFEFLVDRVPTYIVLQTVTTNDRQLLRLLEVASLLLLLVSGRTTTQRAMMSLASLLSVYTIVLRSYSSSMYVALDGVDSHSVRRGCSEELDLLMYYTLPLCIYYTS